jgi:hypothetical protein
LVSSGAHVNDQELERVCMHVARNCVLAPKPSTLPLPATPAAMCALAIRPTSAATTSINVAEVELYDVSGARIPTDRMPITMSSVLMGDGPAKCKDGNAGSLCHSLDPASGDSSPVLRAFYPCSGGRSGLSKVVVVNRQDCCRDRLDQFTLDFLTPAGTLDWPASYTFSGARASHTIAVGSESALSLVWPLV